MSEKYHEVETQNETEEVVELIGDCGEVLKFFHIGTINYKKEWFAFFQPAEKIDGADPDEVVIFRISGDEGNEVLLPIDDENLLEEVYDEFMKDYDDEYDENDVEYTECDGICEGCSGCKDDEPSKA